MSEHELNIRLPVDFDDLLQAATGFFWRTRAAQATAQGATGVRDRGMRSAVTGGKQMDGFAELITRSLGLNGVPPDAIFQRAGIELPGYFRPTKQWDLLVVYDGTLIAALELKSQV